MTYEIIFNLNELGQQVIGKATRVFNVDIDESKDIQKQIEEIADKSFPKNLNLYSNYDICRSMEDAKQGDIVAVHNPKPSNEVIQIGEVEYVYDNEIRIVYRGDNGEKCYDCYGCRFTKMGREIGPNEKNKKWISFATDAEIAQYNIKAQYGNMIAEITDRVLSDEYTCQELEYKRLTDLTAEQLKRILDIFNE